MHCCTPLPGSLRRDSHGRRRASAIVGATLDPRERYDNAPLSSRTTFDSVSHALFASVLADKDSGEPLGRTFDLINHIETIHGQIDGTNPDKQFRLYVTLKPGARDKLDKAQEFNRVMDNGVVGAKQLRGADTRQWRAPGVQRPDSYRFTVSGKPAAARELKQGMQVTATKIVEEPQTEISTDNASTGKAPK